MVAVMSMTPLHMHHMGYDLVVVGFTISLHIAGMYAFSPIFGWLSDRIGKVRVVLLGQVIYVAALAIAGFGQHDRTLVTIGLVLAWVGLVGGYGFGVGAIGINTAGSRKDQCSRFVRHVDESGRSFRWSGIGFNLGQHRILGPNAAAFIPVALIVIFSASLD